MPSRRRKLTKRSSVDLRIKEYGWDSSMQGEGWDNGDSPEIKRSIHDDNNAEDKAKFETCSETLQKARVRQPTVHQLSRAIVQSKASGASCDARLELQVLKAIALREGFLERIRVAVDILKTNRVPVTGSGLGNLLLETRNASIEVVQRIDEWRGSDKKLPFMYEGQNYLLRMCSDLNILDSLPNLALSLGLTSEAIKWNPFMMPHNLTDRPKTPKALKYDNTFITNSVSTQERTMVNVRKAEKILLKEIKTHLGSVEQFLRKHTVAKQDTSANLATGNTKSELKPSNRNTSQPTVVDPVLLRPMQRNQWDKAHTWHKEAEQQLRMLGKSLAKDSLLKRVADTNVKRSVKDTMRRVCAPVLVHAKETRTGPKFSIQTPSVIYRKGTYASRGNQHKTLQSTTLHTSDKKSQKSAVQSTNQKPAKKVKTVTNKTSLKSVHGHNTTKKKEFTLKPVLKCKNSKSVPWEATERLGILPKSRLMNCGTLTAEKLFKLSKLHDPTPAIALCVSAVLILLSDKDKVPTNLDWQSLSEALSVENGQAFRKRLLEFKSETVSKFKIRAIQPLLVNPLFHPHALKEVSETASALSQWLLSTVSSDFRFMEWLGDEDARIVRTASRQKNHSRQGLGFSFVTSSLDDHPHRTSINYDIPKSSTKVSKSQDSNKKTKSQISSKAGKNQIPSHATNTRPTTSYSEYSNASFGDDYEEEDSEQEYDNYSSEDEASETKLTDNNIVAHTMGNFDDVEDPSGLLSHAFGEPTTRTEQASIANSEVVEPQTCATLSGDSDYSDEMSEQFETDESTEAQSDRIQSTTAAEYDTIEEPREYSPETAKNIYSGDLPVASEEELKGIETTLHRDEAATKIQSQVRGRLGRAKAMERRIKRESILRKTVLREDETSLSLTNTTACNSGETREPVYLDIESKEETKELAIASDNASYSMSEHRGVTQPLTRSHGTKCGSAYDSGELTTREEIKASGQVTEQNVEGTVRIEVETDEAEQVGPVDLTQAVQEPEATLCKEETIGPRAVDDAQQVTEAVQFVENSYLVQVAEAAKPAQFEGDTEPFLPVEAGPVLAQHEEDAGSEQVVEDAEPVQVVGDIEPVQVEEDAEPVQVVEDTKPVQVEEDAEPVQVVGDIEPVQVVEDIEPVQVANEQTESEQAVEDIEPVQVADEQTESEQAVEDTEPVQVVEDTEPVQVVEDTEPVQVVEDTEPVQVVEDTEPVQVVEDTKPVQVEEDAEPFQVEEDAEPVQVEEDTEPAQLEEDTEPAQLEEETESAQVVEDTEPVQFVEDTGPVQVVEDTEPVQREEDTESEQAVEDTKPVQVEEETESEQAVEDTEPVQVVEDTEPAQLEEDSETVLQADEHAALVQIASDLETVLPVVENITPAHATEVTESAQLVEDTEARQHAESSEPVIQEDAETAQVVEEAESEQVVEEAESEQVVEEAESEQVVEEAELEQVVEEAESEQVVGEAESEQVEEDAEPILLQVEGVTEAAPLEKDAEADQVVGHTEPAQNIDKVVRVETDGDTSADVEESLHLQSEASAPL